jgi:signal transduction histidine kinase
MTEPSEQRIEELQRQVLILTQLAEISAALNVQMELDPLLATIMAAVTSITECEAASVLLWDTRHNQLVFAASTSTSTASNLIGKPVPIESIAGTILRTNEIVQVDDTKQDPRHYDKVDDAISFETRSLLGVPMTYKDRVIGVLEAINKRALPWTVSDQTYLQILAAQAAVAIEGAKLVMRLKRANEEMAELDRLKNNFIAIASHELRTPLGVIMGYASFLQMEESTSAQENASKVMESALKLRKIIEDMVNLRYLKQKPKDLSLEETTVGALFQAFQREAITQLESRQHNIEIHVPDPDLPIKVDATRLIMVLTNLLNNAMTFTDAHDTIRLHAFQGDGRTVSIAMTDTGLGLPSDQTEKIFEEFYQVEDHMTRRHGGLGIGLSIARAIVDAHHGTITATSAGLGQGATFTIRLPLPG